METKHCKKCDSVKGLQEFAKNKGKADGLQTVCKLCQKTYRKDYYQENKSYYKKKAKERNRVVRKQNQDFIIEYLNQNPCVDCGETDIIVLDFDHVDPAIKTKEVSVLAGQGYRLQTVKEEVAKCEVRCANCHRRKTAKERGAYRLGDIIQQVE